MGPPKGGAPKVGAPKGGAPKGGGPKFRAFSLSCHIFFLSSFSWRFLRGNWWCLKHRGLEMRT